MKRAKQSGSHLPAVVAARLRASTEVFAEAGCRDLALPVTFIRDQIAYAADAVEKIPPSPALPMEPEAALLLPANTEGAMAAYLVTLARAMGFRVHVKVSQRCGGVARALQSLFAGTAGVTFHDGSGARFLDTVLAHPAIRFIQVFGDDTWIGAYEPKVRESGKTLAFDGPGSDPFVVLPGADLDAAAEGAFVSGVFAGGCACMSPERFFVHRDLAEPFLERLVARAAAVKPLPPDRPDAILGYCYSARAAARITVQVSDAVRQGARLLLRGSVRPVEFADKTFFACEPVVLADVPPDAPVMREETFGPVWPVGEFSTIDEAVVMAESSPYRLTATVFGPADVADRVAARLRESHAVVYVNQTMLDAFDPDYWGSGGFGRSGWVWEPDETGHLRTRAGYRPLRSELARVLARVTGHQAPCSR